MLKEFMKEVADIEAAGEFIDPVSKEVGGEEVVGYITDPFLKALIIAGENRAKSYIEKLPWVTKEKELQTIREESNILDEIILAEVHLHLGIHRDTIDLRKGWTIVRKKEEQPMPEPQVLGLAIPRNILDVLNALDGGCSDPNCLIHGRGRTISGRPKRRAEA